MGVLNIFICMPQLFAELREGCRCRFLMKCSSPNTTKLGGVSIIKQVPSVSARASSRALGFDT